MARRALCLILILGIVSFPTLRNTALAQGDCDLSAEDCEILAASDTAMADASSFNIDSYSINLAFSADDSTFNFSVEGAGPVVLGDDFAADLTFDNASITVDNEVQSGNGGIRIIDGQVFLAIEEAGELRWYGLSTEDVEGSPEDLEETLGGLGELELGDLATVSRGENVTIDGQEMAVFYTDMGVAEFLTSELVVEGLTDLVLQSSGEELSPILAATLVATILGQLADEISDSSTFRITRYISLDDYYITFVGADIVFDLNLDFVRGFDPEIDEMLPESGISFAFNFAATMSQHNSEFTIEAPADYEDITDELGSLFEDLLGSGDFLPSPDFDFGFGGGDSVDSVAIGDAEFTIETDSEVTGTLTDSNITDTYRFSGNAGSQIVIVVRAADTSGFLDPKVTLYDSEGTLLVENDDADNPPAELELGSLDSYLTFELPADGDYVISVGSVFAVDNEDYVLSVQVQ